MVAVVLAVVLKSHLVADLGQALEEEVVAVEEVWAEEAEMMVLVDPQRGLLWTEAV